MGDRVTSAHNSDLPDGLTMVSNDGDVLSDQEEGEINDEDEMDHPNDDYEDISSEEEFTIRERMAELEAKGSELQLIEEIAYRQPYVFGREVVDDFGKENYFGELSPPSPPPPRLKYRQQQHRTVTVREKKCNHSRQGTKRRHEKSQKPKRTVHRRQKRRKHSTPVPPANDSSSDSEDPVCRIDREYLKAACTIRTGKNQDNWNALRKKLAYEMGLVQTQGTPSQQQQQRQPQQKQQPQRHKRASRKSHSVVRDVLLDNHNIAEDDDEHEVSQLRLLALQTKAQMRVMAPVANIPLPESPDSPEGLPDEQELRMIALKSAYTKKHEARKKRQEVENERPYSPSDDLILTPVQEAPPMYDDFDEILMQDSDDEVQIIESSCEMVEILDSDADDRMEISPELSPAWKDYHCQHPIDMDLVNSNSGDSIPPPPPPPNISGYCYDDVDNSSEVDMVTLIEPLPAVVKEAQSGGEMAPTLPAIESRPSTPDSMEEAEAEALREFLLSKMRQKRTRKSVDDVPSAVPEREPDEAEQATSDDPAAQRVQMPIDALVNDITESSTILDHSIPRVLPTGAKVETANPNLITLIGKQRIVKRRRKKSHVVGTGAVVEKPAPALTRPQIPKTLISASVVVTQKLVNNPNKLINLNQQVPSPTSMRTASPRESALVDTFVPKPVAKLIIQLGNSDTDTGSSLVSDDSDARADNHETAEVNYTNHNASPSHVAWVDSPKYPATPSADQTAIVESNSPVPFAERLDQFLKNARGKVDQAKSNDNGVTAVNSNEPFSGPTESAAAIETKKTSFVTPMVRIPEPAGDGLTKKSIPIFKAVRHLPRSSQMEYKRLLIRMEALEKQRQFRLRPSVANDRVPPVQTATSSTIAPPKVIVAESSITHDLQSTQKPPDVQNEIQKADVRNETQPPANDVSEDCAKTINGMIVAGQPPVNSSSKRVVINNTVILANNVQTEVATASVDKCPVVPVNVAQVTQPPVEQPQPKQQQQPQKQPQKQPQPPPPPQPQPQQLPTDPGDPILRQLRTMLKRIPALTDAGRQKVLAAAEQRAQRHSQILHQQLMDLIGNIKQVHQERRAQYEMENKIEFLREKLVALEHGAEFHRHRAAVIFPELHDCHRRVIAHRKRSCELNAVCVDIGRAVTGDTYQLRGEYGSAIGELLASLTSETKKLKDMKKMPLSEYKLLLAEMRRKQMEAKAAVSHSVDETVVDRPKIALSTSTVEVPRGDAISETGGQPSETGKITGDVVVHRTVVPHSMHSSPLVTTSAAPAPVASVGAIWKEEPLENTADVGATDTPMEVSRLEKYTSPLVSLKDQGVQHIPNGVLCPYQMSGECVDQDCKFEHLQQPQQQPA